MRTVALVGLPGCGKSRVGRALALELGWEFLDSDAEIERRCGRTVQELFQEAGEREFRSIEREVIRGFAGRGQAVIATGGGAVLSASSRRLLRAAGPVYYLRVPVDALVRRIGAKSHRPAFAGGVREALERMWRDRDAIYGEVGRAVDAARPVGAVVKEILALLREERQGQGGSRCTLGESAERSPSRRTRRGRYTAPRASCSKR